MGGKRKSKGYVNENSLEKTVELLNSKIANTIKYTDVEEYNKFDGSEPIEVTLHPRMIKELIKVGVKGIPAKPIKRRAKKLLTVNSILWESDVNELICPNCKQVIKVRNKHCGSCGQLLDYSDC